MGGETHTGAALYQSLFEFQGSSRYTNPQNKKVLVLVTDGQ